MSKNKSVQREDILAECHLPFQKRLQEIISEEIEHCKSALGLENAITAANGKYNDKDRVLRVDRRKLAAISNGIKGVSFSFAELHALDTYLVGRGKGIKTLLEAPLLLHALSTRENITFLLGAKPEPRRTYVSHWDTRSLSSLLPTIDRVCNETHFAIEEVLLKTFPNNAVDRDARRLFENERWFSLIESADAQHARNALVCLGSSLACHAAEIMLAHMFHRQAFRPLTGGETEKQLPFRFLWSEDTKLPSAFASIERTPAFASIANRDIWKTLGLRIGSQILRPDRSQGEWNEYGVFAMQRRPTGQIWLVIAGLTGPATYATAQFLNTYSAELPQAQGQQVAPVVWGVVETTITVTRGEGDIRQVIGTKLYKDIQHWPHEKHQT